MTLYGLARQGVWKEHPAGTTLLVEGSPVSSVFVAERGRIRVFRSAPTGREGTLYVLEPGSLCTMSALGALRDVPSPARAIAEDDLAGWAIEASAFRTAFAADPVLRAIVLDTIAFHFGGLIELLDTVQFQAIETRLAAYLLDHAIVRPDGTGHGRLAGTQERIAADLWTAREVVSRGLKSLERRGWLRVERGTVFVDDPDALQRLLDS